VAGACFHAPCQSGRPTVHPHLAAAVSSFSDSVSSSELLRFSLPPKPFRAPDCLPGFRPSSRLHRPASTWCEVSNPRSVPSSGFLNLSTASSARRLAGLFHPAATSRTPPVQGLLPSPSRPPSSGGAAPLPLARKALTSAETAMSTPYAPRLRGLTPGEVALHRHGLTRTAARSPPQVPSPPGALFRRLRPRLPEAPPLLTLAASSFTRVKPSSARLQRLPTGGLGSSVTRLANPLEIPSLPSRSVGAIRRSLAVSLPRARPVALSVSQSIVRS